MTKTIFITGSTDGIGLEAAVLLSRRGHRVLLHGRSPDKLDAAKRRVGTEHGFLADLSKLDEVRSLAEEVGRDHPHLDVLINNAGVYRAKVARTEAGMDVRFAVNTVAPYLLTRLLTPQLQQGARVLNIASAAQAPVDLVALSGGAPLQDGAAYAQSKLAMVMWTRVLARGEGPVMLAVNPGSMLGTKMVREGFGVAGGDVSIGAEILARLAVDEDVRGASGQYYDNDARRFGPPHPAAEDDAACDAVVAAIDALVR